MSRRLNFDPLARPYRWLEYATFGRALERCRFHFLPVLAERRRALVLGDGDGRFLAMLLKVNPQIEADAVDLSPAMLRRLDERLGAAERARVRLYQADIRAWHPPRNGYDLVVSHFFLDCFSQSEIEALVEHVAPSLAPGACWVVSEFARPEGRIAGAAGQALIAMLYAAFRLVTGLRTRSLPDHAAALGRGNFQLIQESRWLRGLLLSQLWER